MIAEMKSHTEYLVFETKKRKEMVHITDQVEQIIRRSGVLCCCIMKPRCR